MEEEAETRWVTKLVHLVKVQGKARGKLQHENQQAGKLLVKVSLGDVDPKHVCRMKLM